MATAAAAATATEGKAWLQRATGARWERDKILLCRQGAPKDRPPSSLDGALSDATGNVGKPSMVTAPANGPSRSYGRVCGCRILWCSTPPYGPLAASSPAGHHTSPAVSPSIQQ